MGQKLYIKTFGCQMNDYDSSRMFEALEASHHVERVEDPTLADILLLNTCSVREKAQEKVFSELGRWRLLKEKRAHVIIGVGGCVASQEGKAYCADPEEVDRQDEEENDPNEVRGQEISGQETDQETSDREIGGQEIGG